MISFTIYLNGNLLRLFPISTNLALQAALGAPRHFIVSTNIAIIFASFGIPSLFIQSKAPLSGNPLISFQISSSRWVEL